MSGDGYQLLDFGHGRRLERFGSFVLDRPCPAAEPFSPALLELWNTADARFEGRNEEKGQWTDQRELPPRWTVALGSLRFDLKRTAFGHLGLFPEQAENWQWIVRTLLTTPPRGGVNEGGNELVRRVHPAALSEHRPKVPEERKRKTVPKVLNLFAYTGGSTLAAAAAGAEVVHVDAAKNVVAWARRNAELSGLNEAPIRWIGEDATKFVKRELKRGNRYDAVILDPPSYGHGPRGEVWRLSKHLPRLLEMCRELLDDRPEFILFTCHTPGYNAQALQKMIEEHFSLSSGRIEAKRLTLCASDGRQLPSGDVVRWNRSPNP